MWCQWGYMGAFAPERSLHVSFCLVHNIPLTDLFLNPSDYSDSSLNTAMFSWILIPTSLKAAPALQGLEQSLQCTGHVPSLYFLELTVGHNQEPAPILEWVLCTDAADILAAGSQIELWVHGEAIQRDPRLTWLRGNLSSAPVSLSSTKTSEPSCDTGMAICYGYHKGKIVMGKTIPLSRSARQ